MLFEDEVKTKKFKSVHKIQYVFCFFFLLNNKPPVNQQFAGIPRRFQAYRETESLRCLLDCPRGLLPVRHARNTSPGRPPVGGGG